MTIVGSGNSHGFHWLRKVATKLITEYLGFEPLGLSNVPWNELRIIGLEIDAYKRDKLILDKGLDLPICMTLEDHRETIKRLLVAAERNFGVNLTMPALR